MDVFFRVINGCKGSDFVNIVLAKDIENCIYPSLIDGRGVRIVLFTCGCPHHCPGCHNKETWDKKNGVIYDVQEVVDYILEIYELGAYKYDGITLSGGDPIVQEGAILELIKSLKEKIPDMDIWCYTGFLYERIKDKEVLKYIDVLIDGPFIEELKGDVRFRGSKNQRLLYLKDGKIIFQK